MGRETGHWRFLFLTKGKLVWVGVNCEFYLLTLTVSKATCAEAIKHMKTQAGLAHPGHGDGV